MEREIGFVHLSDARQIYNDFKGGLLAVARRRVGNQDDAEDLVQDTFLRLHRVLRAPHTVIPWNRIEQFLFRILLHRIVDYYRRTRIEQSAFERMKNEERRRTSVDPSIKDLLQAINCAEELSERQRTIFELRYYGRCRIQSIAEICKVSSGTVKRDLKVVVAFLNALYAETRFRAERKHEFTGPEQTTV